MDKFNNNYFNEDDFEEGFEGADYSDDYYDNYSDDEAEDIFMDLDFDDDIDLSTGKGAEANFEILSASDAFVESMNQFGRIDLDYMSQISGLSKDELIGQLEGTAMVLDPDVFEKTQNYYEGYIPVDLYKTGNIMDKKKKAEKMNKYYPFFQVNVDILNKVMPEKINFSNIHVSLGSSWVPNHIYDDFVTFLMDSRYKLEVGFNTETGKWHIDGSAIGFIKHGVRNTFVYGTRRMGAIQIIQDTMNAKTVKVYDTVRGVEDKNERILNVKETMAAQEKQTLIVQKFYEWIDKQDKVKKELQDVYCKRFVYNLGSRFDGSFLQFPGLNEDVELYKHQRDAIARIILTNNVLLAHTVGAGKTYEMAVGCHERYRMGLSKKNLMVVPNNVLAGAVDAHRYLYPFDKILVVNSKDFTPAKRPETIKKIVEEDYVAIYMAYSSFDKISMSDDYRIQKVRDKILALKEERNKLTYFDWKRRDLQTVINREEKHLEKLIAERGETDTACFDRLGITGLYVDEAHNYKNISIDTKTDDIVGLNRSGSKKCDNLMEKVRWVQKEGGNVVFATGTPLTNSMTDLFAIMSYLQYPELKLLKIDHFDQFINTFGERSKHFEIDVDSVHFRFMTRFSSFHNIPELMALFTEVCDYCDPETSVFDLPDYDGYRDVIVEKSKEQAAYIKDIAERCELVRAHGISRKEDNLLKITIDGRKCALDIRLVEETALVNPNSGKIAACANTCFDMYKSYPGKAQIVFCDLSTPKEGFNVYDELKNRLCALGISADEIAFIHEGVSDSSRKKLLSDLDKGKLRIMIGSTQKLGQGVNVQTNLICIHHLDIPWRPADMVQREGRLIRQGNTNEKVYVYRYVTKGSFDAYNWQLLENKQRFISSFLAGSAAERSERDISDAVLSYAEIKALAIGNELIRKRVEVANDVARVQMAYTQRKRTLEDLQVVINNEPYRREKLEAHLAGVKADYADFLRIKEDLDTSDREAFGEELMLALADNVLQTKESYFDDFLGFKVILPNYMTSDKPFVILRGRHGYDYRVKMKDAKALGCMSRLKHRLEHLNEDIKFDEEELEQLVSDRENALEDFAKGNMYEDELEKLKEQLQDIDNRLEEDAEVKKGA